MSVEDFDGAIGVYLFEVKEDYTKNTPKEIHMYDAYDDAYIVGHTYCLFLEQSESALYPHTIYTSVEKELIIDMNTDTATASIARSDVVIDAQNVSERIEDAFSSDILGEKIEEIIPISESSDIEDVATSADIIVEVQITPEINSNKYVTIYDVDVVSLLKGSANDVPSSLALPPDLDTEKTYYIFLRETPKKDGTYSLFSRTFPAVDSTSVDVSELYIG